jgi:hypothetical protein
MTTDPDIWILITQDGTVSAYDTQHAALNAAIDETDPWIECITITHQDTPPPKRPLRGQQSDETPTNGHPDDPARQTGAHSIRVPTSTGMTAWYNPWTGGGTA